MTIRSRLMVIRPSASEPVDTPALAQVPRQLPWML